MYLWFVSAKVVMCMKHTKEQATISKLKDKRANSRASNRRLIDPY
ncbi:hypothetical protein THF1C08_130179 [Vibrio jasicida]|uniref:Uncharacterized protein n=1 Tax=Vibrio jasicida TaxID=766224 RepID=A0AAU9QI92_9VIBR|nr:hypothetical protein THF1C08_130179 [Vibrio jasicida]CAH1574026.1 hypothetical protein THF1A12_120175 [Vibrio jasicida]